MTQIKNILYVSIVLNAILLVIHFGVIPFFLYLSILFNLGLLWYIKKILEKNNTIENDITEIMEKTELFTNHIENVYELEMYY